MIPKWTAQGIVDHVSAAIVEQGAPSQKASGMCMYRGPNGRKCAAGHLIPDELYHEGLESIGWRTMDEEFYKACGLQHHSSMIWELQRCHDVAASSEQSNDYFIELFQESVIKLCRKFHLNIPECITV